MSLRRLADYFVIVGCSETDNLYHGKSIKGTIIQRFPEGDFKDYPFPSAVELFCQPSGWQVSYVYHAPMFYYAILTDIEGTHSYCGCLLFYEPVVSKKTRPGSTRQSSSSTDQQLAIVEEDEDGHSQMTYYVPKCLCLVTRQKHLDTIKNCMTTIYSAYAENDKSKLERMVGYALGLTNLPPPGGPKLTFSLGGEDTQAIYPAVNESIPTSNKSVAIIFNQLGIHNIIMVFTALVTENKLLLLSSSYTHLVLTAQAFLALLYPLTFSYVYIPILPCSLLDFLTAPTPFLMGVHLSYKRQIPDLYDVVTVNIDEGYVTVPDSIHLPLVPEPFFSKALTTLKSILTPSLRYADMLFPPLNEEIELAMQDKQLRAVFIHLFAEMFSKYRTCLTIIRIHPKPVISFNKATFLERRGLVADDFFNKVLESVAFSTFISHRGSPFRKCDLFDKLLARTESKQNTENETLDELMSKIQSIADILYNNEPETEFADELNVSCWSESIASENKKPFPLLNIDKVNELIKETAAISISKTYDIKDIEPERVPTGFTGHTLHQFVNRRRIDVIKDCVSYIFDNKISDARKIFPSVLRALRSKGAQLALCNELDLMARNKRALLEHGQFDLIVRLLNASLQDEATSTTSAVAAAILPLSCVFFRNLAPGVVQFLYTCLQDHAIWGKHHFWEEAFYAEAQNQIIELYVKEMKKKKSEEDFHAGKEVRTVADLLKVAPENGHANRSVRNSMVLTALPQGRSRTNSKSVGDTKKDSVSLDIFGQKVNPPAMDLASDLLSSWQFKDEDERKKAISEEESIVYSLAILFANRMIYLRVPLDAHEQMTKYVEQRRKKDRALQRLQNTDEGGSIFENMSARTGAHGTAAESTLGTAHDGSRSINESAAWDYDYPDGGINYADSIADSVTKFLLRFVERVCLEADINTDHVKTLQSLVPGLVSLHMETLNEVHRETKNLAPTQKVKIMKPQLLQGEVLQFDGLRCYLIADGRELGVRRELHANHSTPDRERVDKEQDMGSDIGGPCLLPAEGAIFLTNYRVIFKGTPVDQYSSEMIVTRAFPIGSLVKEKHVSGRFRVGPDQWLNDCVQMRSGVFQMLRVCFDEEVDGELVESFRKSLQRLRWPQTVLGAFAFAVGNRSNLSRTLSQRHQSIKKSQKSLTNAANLAKKKANQNRGSLRKHKNAMTEDNSKRQYQNVDRAQGGDDESEDDAFSEDSALKRESALLKDQVPMPNMGALAETVLCMDYERVGLGSVTKLVIGSPWRLSMANLKYNICRGYPAVVVTPAKVSDDIMMKIQKNYRANRLPVAVWRHRRSKGTLLRCGGLTKGVIAAAVKAGTDGASDPRMSIANASFDERFFSEIVNATALTIGKGKSREQSISVGAALSLSAINEDLTSVFTDRNSQERATEDSAQAENWKPANLYIYCDKATAKNIKFEPTSKCCFVAAEVHDAYQIKTSFNKLLKICCPSSHTDSDNFYNDLEESKWLYQVSNILELACSVASLIEIQGSSCLVTFSDGSDATSQITSLAQLMLDPFYRTMDGFKVLVEKEWLSFGYRFAHRGNHILSYQSGLSPYFLQFLDAAHQIMNQYTSAFEFNNYFLCFLAYHHTSMRFNTFMLDSEYERSQQGWLQTNQREETTGGYHRQTGQCIWDYIEHQVERSTIFHNFKYHPSLCKGVLQPFCNIANLQVWGFYLNENLYTGGIYDLEFISDMDTVNPNNEATSQSQATAVEVKEDWRQCLIGYYGDTSQFVRDEASFLLNEVLRLGEELDRSNVAWKSTWFDIDVNKQVRKMTRSMHWEQLWQRHRALALQKRLTMEIVMQGKTASAIDSTRREPGFEQNHNFQLHSYYSSTICNYCLKPIRGYNAGLQCSDCAFNVHVKCQSLAPTACNKQRLLQDQKAWAISTSTHSMPGVDNSTKTASNPRNYKGKLLKRGHLLRQWVARWYVLETQQNQLLYYDNEDDTQLKGHIDLGEMKAARVIPPPPSPPKGSDLQAFFEIETTKRVHIFLAPDRDIALEWTDRLNTLLT